MFGNKMMCNPVGVDDDVRHIPRPNSGNSHVATVGVDDDVRHIPRVARIRATLAFDVQPLWG